MNRPLPDATISFALTKESLKEKKNILFFDKLGEIELSVDKSIKGYNFMEYAKTIYSFVWDDFCNDYLEKTRHNTSIETIYIHYNVLYKCLKLLHPITPFITEEIYQKFKETYPSVLEFKEKTLY